MNKLCLKITDIGREYVTAKAGEEVEKLKNQLEQTRRERDNFANMSQTVSSVRSMDMVQERNHIQDNGIIGGNGQRVYNRWMFSTRKGDQTKNALIKLIEFFRAILFKLPAHGSGPKWSPPRNKFLGLNLIFFRNAKISLTNIFGVL